MGWWVCYDEFTIRYQYLLVSTWYHVRKTKVRKPKTAVTKINVPAMSICLEHLGKNDVFAISFCTKCKSNLNVLDVFMRTKHSDKNDMSATCVSMYTDIVFAERTEPPKCWHSLSNVCTCHGIFLDISSVWNNWNILFEINSSTGWIIWFGFYSKCVRCWVNVYPRTGTNFQSESCLQKTLFIRWKSLYFG